MKCMGTLLNSEDLWYAFETLSTCEYNDQLVGPLNIDGALFWP